MFKIPDWEDDNHGNKFSTIVKIPKEKKKLKNSNLTPSVKQNGVTKPNFKTKKTKKKNKINSKEILLINNVKSNVSSQKSNKEENNGHGQEEAIPMEVSQVNDATLLAKKQKSNKKAHKKNKNNSKDKVNLKNDETDKVDKSIIMEKKKKLGKVENDITFNENSIGNKVKSKTEKKKELIKSLLQNEKYRNHINIKSQPLRDRMLERLKAAKFRFLNEKLYTTSGSEAQKLFKEDPTAFQTYHEGYQQQMKKWPVKPLDVIIKRIQKMPKTYKIADMGCGKAELSRRVSQTVRSFDLIARVENVEECDIAHTPIPAATLDVAVYCLALMGTNLTQYLLEANRVLRIGGYLLIAEVESRFNKVEDFVKDVQKLGFSLKKLDKTHEVFYFMEFTKIRDPPSKKGKIPTLTLKPCIYKKR
ncbi:unnamed protein product [Euphydryas editha]|uniref:Ribosomal RNA-processing protein 8 n=1 Tax=Euphydryas editha TaxID=104508 RepID=A0AAU9TXN0_EUPED|nr:unnamed protein product [Euphydryas editha]